MSQTGPALTESALTERLRELTEKFDVPGASVAILDDDTTTTTAVGLLNRETGVEATTDSLWQIGSITKTYTASLVQRFSERGELDLDTPIRSYLAEFKVADQEASETVTLRHLLTHTSGIDGDHFQDTGRGDDVLEKYVASCAGLTQQFPVGATMSYCNAGFGITGRVLEKVTGKVWDQVLRDELLAPLGLEP
jgi:CubicO group peptidase (beta-lactamase class C family)